MTSTTLFSVIVITFNSEKYILETLESIREQQYEQLELIISDDCSTDNTAEICRQWLTQNKDRFVNATLLVPEKNQGIPANCNQGLKAANGEWIKIIAGDDAFFPGTFEQAAKFIGENPQASAFASSVVYFNNDLSPENEATKRDDSWLPFYNVTATRQHFLLLRNNYIHGAAVFLKRALLLEIGGFNEKYRMLEDHPMWLTLTAQGDKFYYMPYFTVKYRLHTSSIFSHTSAQQLFNNFYAKKRAFELDMIYPSLRWYEQLSYHQVFYIKKLMDSLKLNNTKPFNKFLYRFLNALTPVAIINTLKGRNS